MISAGRPRPYWHVDVKWIFGILFTGSLIVSLASVTVATLISPDVAIPTAAYVVATQFSRDGLDDPADIEQVRRQYATSSQEVFYPLGGTDVAITRDELYTLSPRELRLKIFRQVVESLYYQERTPETLQQYGLLAPLNHRTARLAARIQYATLIPLGLTLTGLVAFSHRFGRLVSPAVPLLLVSTPLALLLWLVQNTTPPAGDTGPFSVLPRELIVEIAAALAPAFYLAFWLGIALLACAVTLTIVSRVRQKKVRR